MRMGEQNAARGMAIGAVVGLVAAAALLTEQGFEMRPGYFKLITAGYPFVGSILMGAIVGAWKKKTKAPQTNKASA